MGLFGKAKEPSRIHSNAPRDWPAVDPRTWTGNPGLDSLMIFGDLLPGLTGAGGRVLGMLDRRLYEEGLVTIPLVVEVGGQRFGVFIYPKSDEEAAAHYSAVRSLLRQREQMTAVYYAPEPILPARPSTALEPLGPGHFAKAADDRPAAEYALFWPSPEDPTLAASAALGCMDRWFEALDGRFYLYLSMLTRELELSPEEEDDDRPQIYGLPAQPLVVGVEGPDRIALYLHASQREGLYFAFDTRTPAARRNLLLRHLAQSAEMVRQAADERRAPKRDAEKHALATWREHRAAFLRQEKEGATGLRLGLVSEQGTARVIAPGATSAETRRAVSPGEEPSEALLDLVRSQLDHAFDEVRRAGEGGGEGPNLVPFVAAQAGADLWRTYLPLTNEPEAVAFVPQILADRPACERAVLVCDGYLRVDGQRSDAVVVHAQERGDAGRFVFAQRYRTGGGGKVDLLGNWLLTGRDASLWPAVAPPGDVPPSPRLRAFVEERLRERLRWMALGERDDEVEADEALLSPHLEYVKEGKTYTRAFMFMSLLDAVAGTRKGLAAEAACELASLEFDDVTTRNGRPDRSLRFWAHERGTPRAFLFAQPYDPPARGKPFGPRGSSTLLRAADPLFPS